MNKYTLLAALLIAPSIAFAAGEHSGGHDHDEHGHGNHAEKHSNSAHHQASPIGVTGHAKHVSKTIAITMLETDDGEMLFTPTKINVKAGETVRLSFTNNGEIDHEFVMDGAEGIEKHRKEMLASTGKAHHDHHGSNSISLKPGASGEIIWKFASSGNFEFACLIPGHYELGMHGVLSVE